MDQNKMDKIDENALNSASWKFFEEWGKLLDDFPSVRLHLSMIRGGWLFNNIKRLIRPVIQEYLEKLNEPK